MIKIDDVLHPQFVAAGDTQWANGNEGPDATYIVNRKWLNNFAKLLIEQVVDMCASKSWGGSDHQTVVNLEDILQVKQKIIYE